MAKSFRDLINKTGNKKTEAIAKQRTEELLQQIDRLTLSDIEIEALETTIKMWLVSPQAESVSKVIQNLLERTKQTISTSSIS